MIWSLLGKLKLTRGRYPSTASRLKNFLTVRQAQTVGGSARDERFLVYEAAKVTPFAEEELTKQIAQQMSLGAIFRIPPLPLGLLNGAVTLESLSKCGATLLTTQGMVTGVVCVCPRLADPILRYYPGRPAYLSTWSLIAQNLNEAEKMLHDSLLREEQRRQQAIHEVLARDVLGLVVSEVQKFGAAFVELHSIDDGLEYRFKALDGREGAGVVHRDVRDALVIFLSALSARGIGAGERIRLQGDLELPIRVLVTPRGGYRVVWQVSHENADRREPEPLQTEFVSEAVGQDTDPHPYSALGGPSHGEVRIDFEAELEDGDSPGEMEQASAGIVPLSLAPMLPPPSQAALRDSAAKREDDLVLLVEDCIQFATLLTKILGKEGIRVIHAESGEEALTLLNGGVNPALCVCDLHMPIMNGFGFLKALRSRPGLEDLSVIMLTSDSDDEVQIKGLENGADAFIGKTEHPRVLLAHVRRFIQREKRRAAA